MLKRSIPFSAVVCICAAILPFARGDNLSVQLFPYTGEVRLGNPNAAAFSFVYYSLSSPGGALNANPAVWKSITDVYDVSGNGLIDPLNNWLKLSASSSQLAEGVIQNPGGSLAPFSVVSLGKVWNRSATPHPDIAAQAVQANQQFATVTTEFGIDGDYNNDNMVNMADYNLWKQLFGQSNNPFLFGGWKSKWRRRCGRLHGLAESCRAESGRPGSCHRERRSTFRRSGQVPPCRSRVPPCCC